MRILFVVALLALAGACGAFGSDGSSSSPPAIAADASSPTATIRCASTTCPATQQCCLPLDQGAALCVERGAVCPAGFGEIQCSSPTACNAGEVCCVTPARGSGQVAFDVVRSFCVPTSACPDQDLQHQLCDLGLNAQCPGRACKPYREDREGPEVKPINPDGYATCQ